jgi:hypothetical protein
VNIISTKRNKFTTQPQKCPEFYCLATMTVCRCQFEEETLYSKLKKKKKKNQFSTQIVPQLNENSRTTTSSAGLHLQYSSKDANPSTPLYKPPFPRRTVALKHSKTVIS